MLKNPELPDGLRGGFYRQNLVVVEESCRLCGFLLIGQLVVLEPKESWAQLEVAIHHLGEGLSSSEKFKDIAMYIS